VKRCVPSCVFGLAFLWIVAIASPACAQPDAARRGPPADGGPDDSAGIEVTAYRVPTAISETTQGVDVVTRRELDARKPATVIDLLGQIPGLHVDQAGAAGGIANVYIRGSDPNHVLVVVNGIRMNDPTTSRGGGYDFSSLEVDIIERIEIIRGGGSAIYGAEAMGGVINIVTRRNAGTEVSGSVSGGVGTHGYMKESASLSGGTGAMRFTISGSSAKDGRAGDGGTADQRTFSANLQFSEPGAFELRLTALGTARTSSGFPDDSGGLAFAARRTLEQRRMDEESFGGNLRVHVHERARLEIGVSAYRRTENIASPGVAPGARDPAGIPASISQTGFDRETALVSMLLKLPLRSDLSVGFERISENGKNRSTYFVPVALPANFTLSRITTSQFAELKVRPAPELVGRLGVRIDSPSGFRSQTSPSAGVRYTASATETVVKANWGKGFRPPSFFALANPLVGNPHLVPETSTSREIGVEQPFWHDRATGAITWFRNGFRNLVDFDPGPPARLVNRSRVDARGVESRLVLTPSDRVSVSGTMTFVDEKIEQTNASLRNRPRWRGGLAASYRLDETTRLTGSARYVGKVFDSSIPTGAVFLDPYWRTDVMIEHKSKALVAFAGIDNVFNRRFQQFVGFQDVGVRIRTGVQVLF